MTTNTESTATYLPGLNPRLVTQSLTPNLLCAYCGGVALSTMKDTNNHSFCYGWNMCQDWGHEYIASGYCSYSFVLDS